MKGLKLDSFCYLTNSEILSFLKAIYLNNDTDALVLKNWPGETLLINWVKSGFKLSVLTNAKLSQGMINLITIPWLEHKRFAEIILNNMVD